MAALFHDIGLQNDELAKIKTLDELDSKADQFTEYEVSQFMDHPMAGAQLVMRLSKDNAEAEQAILQHHERPNGSGFPRKLKARYISPTAALFMVAHDFVAELMEKQDQFDAVAFHKQLKEVYFAPNFRGILKALDPGGP